MMRPPGDDLLRWLRNIDMAGANVSGQSKLSLSGLGVREAVVSVEAVIHL